MGERPISNNGPQPLEKRSAACAGPANLVTAKGQRAPFDLAIS